MKNRTCLSILFLCGCLLVSDRIHAGEGNSVNVALGKTVLYSIKPGKWKDNDEQSILTDGIKAEEGSGEYHNMIGYHGGKSFDILETVGINMCMDLRQVEVLKETRITLNGHVRWGKPREVTCVISRDGTNFYTVATRQKVGSYGKATKPFSETYAELNPGEADNPLIASEDAVKEIKPQGWQTLIFDLSGLEARYVGLHVKGAGIIFNASEWEVYNAPGLSKNETRIQEVYAPERKAHFRIGYGLAPTDDVYFGPRDDIAGDTLYISDNILTPNFCYLVDRRLNGKPTPGPEDKAPLTLVISLPDGVELLKTKQLGVHNFRFKKDPETKRNIYSLVINQTRNTDHWTKIYKYSHVGPFYFSTTNSISGDEVAEFYCKNKYASYTLRTVPIRTITIPKVENELPFPVSLTWMFDWHSLDWPGFFTSYKHMGFNALPLFPRFYMSPANNFAMRDDVKTLIEQARTNDLKIILNASPLHMIIRNAKGNEEAKCQGTDLYSWICPSYSGPLYVKEMERIRRLCEQIQPDLLMADIEVFSYDRKGAKDECTRCLNGQLQSGLGKEEYFAIQGTRIMKDIADAAKSSGKNTKVGLYGCAGNIYHGIFDFDQLYPQTIQTAQASLYEAGRLDIYHRAFKEIYSKTGENWVSFPWMTAGTYGEFASYKLESMMYEAVLNGASIGFYSFSTFDTALDYFYVAQALSNLSHYTDLLSSGKPVPYSADNSRVFYSCFMNDDEALVHVGNYTFSQDEEVFLTSPIEGAVTVKDVKTGVSLSLEGDGVTVTIPPQQSVLLSFKE